MRLGRMLPPQIGPATSVKFLVQTSVLRQDMSACRDAGTGLSKLGNVAAVSVFIRKAETQCLKQQGMSKKSAVVLR